jgi:hypothetical protein
MSIAGAAQHVDAAGLATVNGDDVDAAAFQQGLRLGGFAHPLHGPVEAEGRQRGGKVRAALEITADDQDEHGRAPSGMRPATARA